MADTYTASLTSVPFATNKIMFAGFNGSGSGVIMKVYRLWVKNIQTTAIVGVPVVMEIKRISTFSGGIPAQTNRYSTNNAAIPAQVQFAAGATVTEGGIFRRFPYSTDEPLIGTGTVDEIELQRPWMCFWDYGGNTNDVIQPLVLREGQGVAIKNITTVAVFPFIDITCEFTLE